MARTRQIQQHIQFGLVKNSELLSNHWLDQRLPLEPEWTEYRAAAETALDSLATLWNTQSHHLPHYTEAQLEDKFIQPILATLGWEFLYQTPLRNRRPDYALFASKSALENAIPKQRTEDFWTYPLLLADAKQWSVSLDHPSGTGSAREFPPQQIEWYLDAARLPFGILTNGRQWRLFPHDRSASQKRFETYLECDLGTLLSRWQSEISNHLARAEIAEDFLRFYLFFSPVGHTEIQQRSPLIRRAITGSSEYRQGVGQGLKDRVFEALRLAIEGFIRHTPNNLTANDLPEIRRHSFTLLYRLLFSLFAEDRQLLPYRKNDSYTRNRSLSRFRDEIADTLDKYDRNQHPGYDANSTVLYNHLNALFDLIDSGHQLYGVPAYNGGLFDAAEHQFLAEKHLPDLYSARLIDALSRAADPDHPDLGLTRIDYKDLAIQHLGNVYEGLLELQPHYADVKMQLIRSKAKRDGQRAAERLIAADQPIPDELKKDFERTDKFYLPGEVYLLTDKGERRASGSYYTPDHIVNYIVENTLGPLCRDIDQKLSAEISATQAESKTKRGTTREIFDKKLAQLRADFADRILALKVLDPAMGSGHFLIRACQFLAEEIATNPHTADPSVVPTPSSAGASGADAPVGRNAGILPASPDDTSTLIYWKRKVVENCLYGVDLNPVAVELAKLALWLETVSTTQPLSFLDHHLRHGNSLVGAAVDQLDHLPGEIAIVQNAFQNQIATKLPILLGSLQQIRNLSSDSVPDVKKKEAIFLQTVESVRAPFRQIADLWISTYFLESFLKSEVSNPKSPLKSEILNLKSAHVSPADYSALINALGVTKTYTPVRNSAAFQVALAAAHAVSPFHWEIEFPDVFYDHKGRLPNPGFHAIIGNPPYDVLSEKENKIDLSAMQTFIETQPALAPSLRGKNNLYKLFICQALHLMAKESRLGLITPMAILGDDQSVEIRKLVLANGAFTYVDAFPQKDDPESRVFREAKLSTTVFGIIRSNIEATKKNTFIARVHPEDQIKLDSPALTLSSAEIPAYDPLNLTVVSCAQVDWNNAVRIMKSGRLTRLDEFTEFAQGEVNETIQRGKGNLAINGADGQLVTRGAAICLYIRRESSQGDDLFLKVADFLNGAKQTSKAFDHRHRRVALQESSPQNNFRRIIACLLPAGEFCNHTINYLAEPKSKIPLEFVLALLNSQLVEWYFRLGSTNAHVSHYQLRNLPCPIFSSTKSQSDRQLFNAAKVALDAQDFPQVLALLEPACQTPPFPPAIQDIIIAAVERIILLEQNRGTISRSDRSHLAPAAQPYQNLIDQLFYRLAGLTPQESAALESRLATML